MRPEHHRWGMIRMALECPECSGQVRLLGPTPEVTCEHCGAAVSIPEGVYTGLALDLAQGLDALPVGATRHAAAAGREGLEVIYGRQWPLCWQCGSDLLLSAADIGRNRPVVCTECGAQSETCPPPEWLKAQVPDAVQIYGVDGVDGTGEHTPAGVTEPIWIRCPACDVGQRVDGATPRITRCSSCRALHHLPDEVWAALHPVRHHGPWYILFERMSPEERAETRQALALARAALAAIGESLSPDAVYDHLEALKALPSLAYEDALFRALESPCWWWFAKGAEALAADGSERALGRLGEALAALEDPRRVLHLAKQLLAVEPDSVAEVCAHLAQHADEALANEALAIWVQVDFDAALQVLRTLIREGGPERAVSAARLRRVVDPALAELPQAFDTLLEHEVVEVRRATARLLEASTARSAERLLQSLLELGADPEFGAHVGAIVAALPGEVAREGLIAAAHGRSGEARLRSAQAIYAAGMSTHGEGFVDLLDVPDAAEAAAEIILAEAPERVSRALCRLLDAPTLQVRLRAAEALESVGTEQAIPALRQAAEGWFVNRTLRKRAELAIDAIQWRHRQRQLGGLSVTEGPDREGGLSEELP
ncbi:MAG: hypothetical protein ACE366_31385 [Bradymonadia bacterium]